MRSQGNLWQRNDGQGNKPENFSSHSSAHHSPAQSSIKEMILTDCTAERAALVKFCLDDPAKNRFAPSVRGLDRKYFLASSRDWGMVTLALRKRLTARFVLP
jgi:hypothetical protein